MASLRQRHSLTRGPSGVPSFSARCQGKFVVWRRLAQLTELLFLFLAQAICQKYGNGNWKEEKREEQEEENEEDDREEEAEEEHEKE